MIKIRFAKPDELRVVKEVYRKGFKEWTTGDPSFYYFLKLINRDRIKDKEILLAFDGKTPVGLCMFSLKTTVFSESAFLDILVVIEEYRSKGIGKLLVRAFLKSAKAKKVRLAFLSTWQGNWRSMKFYKRLGFKRYGHVFEAVATKCDEIFFSRKP
jgi:ribosomal-protein-alanine N-acetyltransferase